MSPLVYIVVVNYDGIRWLAECLGSLFETKYDNFEIILVDNNSSDGSVDFIRSSFPTVLVIQNDRNLGFCKGNNVGISQAMKANAEYIVLLNNDTKVTEDWLSTLVGVGEENPLIGVLGSVQLVYEGNDFNSWTKTTAVEHLKELSEPGTARMWIPMRWVEGSCFAIKRQLINEVGMLDPIYFMYFEEIDYCRRVSAHGYKIALIPRSRIHHFRGGSSRSDPTVQRIRAFRYDRSNLIYHLTDLRYPFVINLFRFVFALGRRMFERIMSGNFQRVWDLIVIQPEILRSLPVSRRKWKMDRQRLQNENERIG